MLVPQVPIETVFQIGNSLYNFPVSVGTPNFWLDEAIFNAAFLQYGTLAAPFIANGLPPGVQPWIYPYSASSFTVADSVNTSFNFDSTVASQPATEVPYSLVAMFDTAVGYESGTLYETTDPGDTVDTLLSFGELDNNTVLALETIGGQDFSDFYHFSISETNVFVATLDNLSADADLGLFDANGQLLASSENAGTVGEEIAVMLAAGDYTLGVVSYDGIATNYDLGVLADDGSSFVAAAESFATTETAIF